MNFPEIITRLPAADLPIPAEALRTSVLASAQGQLVFFDVLTDIDLPPHSHKAQWGTVVEGEIELTIGGVTKRYRPGEPYFIPSGVVHSARAFAGSKIIEFFEEPNRYKLRG